MYCSLYPSILEPPPPPKHNSKHTQDRSDIGGHSLPRAPGRQGGGGPASSQAPASAPDAPVHYTDVRVTPTPPYSPGEGTGGQERSPTWRRAVYMSMKILFLPLEVSPDDSALGERTQSPLPTHCVPATPGRLCPPEVGLPEALPPKSWALVPFSAHSLGHLLGLQVSRPFHADNDPPPLSQGLRGLHRQEACSKLVPMQRARPHPSAADSAG